MGKKTKISVFVELKTAEFPIHPETMKAVNEAAEKVCKLLPRFRLHKLASISKSFSSVYLHREYKILGYDIHWGNSGYRPGDHVYLSMAGISYSSLSTCEASYDNSSLTINHVRGFVRDIKSGKLVAELKKQIALAEAKEEAEVKLFRKMRQANDREQAAMILDL
jgi:hypothetical protein